MTLDIIILQSNILGMDGLYIYINEIGNEYQKLRST
jgi:hypothetical protein